MPPKKKVVAAAAPAKKSATTTTTRKTKAEPVATKTTRGKRAASPAPEEEAPVVKKGRAKKATKDDTPEEEQVTPAMEAPKKRGRVAKAEVEDKPAPASKGRGRGKKAAEPEPVVEEAEEVEEPAPAPKKRGRAPKAATAAPVITADEPSSSSGTGKRGRTAKAQIEEELQDAVAEVQAEKPAPKKRGRPAKVATEEPAQGTETKSKGRGNAAVKKTTEPVSAAEVEEVKPKGRGRKPSATKTEDAPKPEPKTIKGRAKKSAAPEPEEIEAQIPEEAISKPKGRGKKVTIAEPEAETEEPVAPAPKGRGRKAAVPVEEEIEQPKRGRPARAKAAVAPQKSARGKAANKAEEEPAAEAAPKKGRGRKKSEPEPVAIEEVIDEVDEVQPGEVQEAEAEKTPRPKATPKGRRKTLNDVATSSSSKSPAAGLVYSAGPKPGGRPPKRPLPIETTVASGAEADDERQDEPVEKPAKRVKRATEVLPSSQAKPSRRQTLAAPKPSTPRTSRISMAPPGTAPAKAGRGRPRKSETPKAAPPILATTSAPADEEDDDQTTTASSGPSRKMPDPMGKPSRRQTMAMKPATPSSQRTKTAVPGTAPAKAVGRPKKTAEPASTPKPVGRPRKSETPAATPKVAKASVKPPKTVPPKKAEKEVAGKCKRVSSPGPAARKRRASGEDAPVATKGKFIKSSDIPAGPSGVSYWLMKAEPESRLENGIDVKFSIDDLQNATTPEPWNGVRNHQAKNNMQAMKKGDLAFFYHSSCKVPGVVGIMEIVEEATPDESAFDEQDPYYDDKSDRENPKWFNVKVAFRSRFAKPEAVTLDALRKHSVPGQPLENMQLFSLSRLSVSKVSPSEWNSILELAGEAEPQSLTVCDEAQATAADEDTSMVEADAVGGADASLIEAEGAAEQDESIVEMAGDVLHDVVEGIAESAAEAIGEEVAIELADEIREQLGDDVAEEVQAEIADEVAEQVEEIVAAQIEDAIAEEIQEVAEEEIAEAVEQAVIDEVEETIETIETGQGIDAAPVAVSIELPEVQRPVSAELSELPDASFSLVEDETLDQVADLPPIPTTARAARAASRGPSLSPSKGVLRRASRGLSAQPTNGASSRPISRAGSRAPSLGPIPNLAPSPADKVRTSRRSSRAPSLGPVAESSDAILGPPSPMRVVEETTTTIIEKTIFPQPGPIVSGGGSTFVVPDESEIDNSSFFGEAQASPTQGLYPDIHVDDDSFGF